jgi:hypothetical protein
MRRSQSLLDCPNKCYEGLYQSARKNSLPAAHSVGMGSAQRPNPFTKFNDLAPKKAPQPVPYNT